MAVNRVWAIMIWLNGKWLPHKVYTSANTKTRKRANKKVLALRREYIRTNFKFVIKKILFEESYDKANIQGDNADPIIYYESSSIRDDKFGEVSKRLQEADPDPK